MKKPDPSIDPDLQTCLRVIRDLEHSDDGATKEGLARLLNHGDLQIRVRATIALIRKGDEQVFDKVISGLFHDRADVAIGAALILGRLKDKRAVSSLIEAFKTNNVALGAAAAWALGQCRSREAIPWLLAALKHKFAAANVCDALGQIGCAQALMPLVKALKAGHDNVRACAAKAMGILNYDGRPELIGDTIEILRPLLQDHCRKVRLCAALSLHTLKCEHEKSGRFNPG